MAGVTDRPFRQLCKQLGAGLAVSEMVTSNSLLYGSKKTQRRANHEGEADPISVQIAGADPAMTLGVGAGQMSRVDSTRIAAIKAKNAGLSLAGSCVASDAFFPFRDGVDVLAEAGALAVIQPGGSVRDAEVIAAADEHGGRHPAGPAPARAPLEGNRPGGHQFQPAPA